MSKFGKSYEALLSFAPDKKLYSISVAWSRSGNVFDILKDALDAKYGKPRVDYSGLMPVYQYGDDDIDITLKTNGIKSNDFQRTSIEYVLKKELPSVAAAKKRIDDSIKLDNVKKAGEDL